MKHRKYAGFTIAGALFSLLLVGCETTAGVGRDTAAAGEAIEDTAQQNQPYEQRSQSLD